MKTLLLLILLAPPFTTEALKSGDVVFVQSRGGQSAALRAAMGSPWTHVGLVFEERGAWYVFEAARVVKSGPWSKFISEARSAEGRFAVFRVKSPEIKQRLIKEWGRVFEVCKKYKGRLYDSSFFWSEDAPNKDKPSFIQNENDKIYCSELVYKCYEDGLGIKLAEFQRLGEMDLSAKPAQPLIQRRWLKGIKGEAQRRARLEQIKQEEVITPLQLYVSPALECVGSHLGLGVCPP